jgi:arylsulfatase A-like enzyme
VINRREFIDGAARAAGAAAVSSLIGRHLGAAQGAAPRRTPNLLFFFPDQHRFDWLGFGDRALPISTPNLERLAGRGTWFRRAVCPAPVCAPSRACLASGREYDRCGVRDNEDNYPLDQPTYYGRLRDGGYHVMGVGKLDLAKQANDWGLDGRNHMEAWGFSDQVNSCGKADGMSAYLKDPVGAKDPYYAYLDGRTPPRGRACADDIHRRRRDFPNHWWADTDPCPLDDDDYFDNWVARTGLELLDRAPADRPWHLVVNFPGPHPPVDITHAMERRVRGPERVVEGLPAAYGYEGLLDAANLMRTRQNYTAMVENIDRWLGIYLDRIDRRGELDDTLVVYSSDHGEMLGDHSRWGKSVPYQASIGVPLLVAGQGVRAGREIDAPIATLDLAATFLDYAGVPVPADMDSRSLRPQLEGRHRAGRDVALSGLRTNEGDFRLAFDGRYKLVRGFGDQATRLHDLEADPRELVNLASRQPREVRRLEEWLPAAATPQSSSNRGDRDGHLRNAEVNG